MAQRDQLVVVEFADWDYGNGGRALGWFSEVLYVPRTPFGVVIGMYRVAALNQIIVGGALPIWGGMPAQGAHLCQTRDAEPLCTNPDTLCFVVGDTRTEGDFVTRYRDGVECGLVQVVPGGLLNHRVTQECVGQALHIM